MSLYFLSGPYLMISFLYVLISTYIIKNVKIRDRLKLSFNAGEDRTGPHRAVKTLAASKYRHTPVNVMSI